MFNFVTLLPPVDSETPDAPVVLQGAPPGWFSYPGEGLLVETQPPAALGFSGDNHLLPHLGPLPLTGSARLRLALMAYLDVLNPNLPFVDAALPGADMFGGLAVLPGMVLPGLLPHAGDDVALLLNGTDGLEFAAPPPAVDFLAYPVAGAPAQMPGSYGFAMSEVLMMNNVLQSTLTTNLRAVPAILVGQPVPTQQGGAWSDTSYSQLPDDDFQYLSDELSKLTEQNLMANQTQLLRERAQVGIAVKAPLEERLPLLFLHLLHPLLRAQLPHRLRANSGAVPPDDHLLRPEDFNDMRVGRQRAHLDAMRLRLRLNLRLPDPRLNNQKMIDLAQKNKQRRPQKHPLLFACDLCDKTFTRPYNLKLHKRTHTHERPFICTVCGKAFARQHDRKRHEELHLNEKKFQCSGSLSTGQPWGCGRRFARTDALARHFKTEGGRACIRPLLDEVERSEQVSSGFGVYGGQIRVGDFEADPYAFFEQQQRLQRLQLPMLPDDSQVRFGVPLVNVTPPAINVTPPGFGEML